MLERALQTATLSHMEVSRRLKADKGLLSRTIRGEAYRPKAFYDSLYDLLHEYGGIVPINNEMDIRAYPSGKDRGTWDIYYKGDFITTLRFTNYNDVLEFVKGDERFQAISSFARKTTEFDNNIRLK